LSSFQVLALAIPNLHTILPVGLGCLGLIIALPVAAARGKLHIPGYVGLALLSFVAGLLLGHFSGVRAIVGTMTGIALSILAILLIAAAVGCVLAVFFYRHPAER
jgi:lysylphosphatidylglycerol synthetase-like protein (DUF2156 family)